MDKRLPGVYPATKKDGTAYYRASLTHNRKHISLGSFSSMEEAHTAYLDADNLLRNSTLTIEEYKGLMEGVEPVHADGSGEEEGA